MNKIQKTAIFVAMCTCLMTQIRTATISTQKTHLKSSDQTSIEDNQEAQSIRLLQTTPINPSPTNTALPLITQTNFGVTTSFQNITLSHLIPIQFLQNQIFLFLGSMTVPNPNGIYVSVIFTRKSDSKQMTFSQYLSPNQQSFSISAFLNLTGTFYLAIFPGSSGVAGQQLYTVNPISTAPITSRPPNFVKTASLNLLGNNLWISWSYNDVSQPCITNLVFNQTNGQSVSFLLSNYQTSFQIPYASFWNFIPGMVTIQISQAFSTTESAFSQTSAFSVPYIFNFNATQHNYAIISSNTGVNSIPFQIINNILIISGNSTQILQNQVILLTPNKQFVSYFINQNQSASDQVIAGTLINISITFNYTGTYILEINNAAGQAIVNIPLYIGNIYPLIPDFMDLSPGGSNPSGLQQPQDLTSQRNLVFTLINNIRNIFQAPPIYLDITLANLAQNYSSEEITGNFFGHVDPQGRTPQQRAQAANISESVGENLALNINLTEAQLMLQRSNGHLRNMVNSIWTRVGLGVLQNSNQAYYLTQQYSSRDMEKYPLTSTELIVIQTGVMNYLQTKYPLLQSQNQQLCQILNSYQTLSSQPDIITYLRSNGINTNIYAINIEVSYNGGNYMSLVEQQSNFTFNNGATYNQIGLSVSYSKAMLVMFGAFV